MRGAGCAIRADDHALDLSPRVIGVIGGHGRIHAKVERIPATIDPSAGLTTQNQRAATIRILSRIEPMRRTPFGETLTAGVAIRWGALPIGACVAPIP